MSHSLHTSPQNSPYKKKIIGEVIVLTGQQDRGSRRHYCGRCTTMTRVWGMECGDFGREGSRGWVQSWRMPVSWGLGQFNGSSNVQMSWFEAVNGESLQFTTHVHHKMFAFRLQTTEWALVVSWRIKTYSTVWSPAGMCDWGRPWWKVGTSAKILALSSSAARWRVADQGTVEAGTKSPGTCSGWP